MKSDPSTCGTNRKGDWSGDKLKMRNGKVNRARYATLKPDMESSSHESSRIPANLFGGWLFMVFTLQTFVSIRADFVGESFLCRDSGHSYSAS
jgi:hypothetical protein